MINKFNFNFIKINKILLIKKVLILITFLSSTFLYSEELQQIYDFDLDSLQISIKHQKKVHVFSTKKTKISIHDAVSFVDLLKKVINLKEDYKFSVISSGKKEIFFDKSDIISKKNDHLAYVLMIKNQVKFKSGDTITIGLKKGDLLETDYDKLGEIFDTRVQTKVRLLINELTTQEVKDYFKKYSLIFIQDNNTDRWVSDPLRIKVYKNK